ncbi:glucans biosynthesis glucosyltransferase MdoH [Paracoccus suum]|uniref:Glucans biosynthesis glucosyltransferase H n=1 Tax=Paracoccus suum TaxID=2259340 RepID=A0A344PPI1_9RHOB|nr:glucans biosynthesis glucosyltransferase MdoH [Paracoccus suum]
MGQGLTGARQVARAAEAGAPGDLAPLALTALPPTPPEAPLEMPAQEFFGEVPEGPARRPASTATIGARVVTFGLTAIIAGVGFWQMLHAFGGGPTLAQGVLLVLFTLTFAWIGMSFASMLAGVIFPPQPRETSAENNARVAVLMPLYHEDAARSAGLLAALAADLEANGLGSRAEIFVLSDSRKPDAIAAEMQAIAQLRALSPVPVWYRRRTRPEGRKAGNVAEFVRRWGGRYEQMVVLDADSIMSGATIAALSDRMAAEPNVGLIQTMPVLVGGQSVFARVVQFAGRVYGPAIARGISAWSGDDGNFWGHNAIIRVHAFAECCGLPLLPGRPPWGGAVLSHDFVEAALMRRAGWAVRLDHDLRGSFEGTPPTLLDMAVRERRWAQGNLQHLKVIGARGFSAISRVHFTIGILGFLMSPIWLGMILVGLGTSLYALLARPDYFPSTYQLFPAWPVFDPVPLRWLFVAAMSFLLLPKFAAVARAWRRPLAENAGGRGRVLMSALFEIVLSTLIAPVQMLTQTRQIGEILRGRDSGWEAQVRAGQLPPWGVVLRHHWLHVAIGVATVIILARLAPGQLVWLSPILAGLILAPLTSRWSGSPVLGRWTRRQNLLVTPEEREIPPIITAAVALGHKLAASIGQGDLMARMATEPDVAERHRALLPVALPERPLAERLDALTARAKIDAAGSQAEALALLTPAERVAVLCDPETFSAWTGPAR